MIHPLRHRAFRLLLVGRTLSALGDAVIPAALALAVLRVTGSTSALALVLACATVPKLLLLPVGGVVADRFDARRVALVTDLVRCAAQLFIGVELLGAGPTLTHIAAASAVGGVASAFAMPTTSPLVAGTLEQPDRQAANALLAVASNATRLGGPALAGLLILTAGPGWAFILDAASFAASAALLTTIRVRRTPIERRSLLADLAEGWTEVRTRDWYWSSLIAHAAWNGAAAILVTLGPVIVVDQLGGEGVWVLVLEAGAVGLLLGSLLAGRVRPKRPILVANLGLATYALPLLLLATAAPAPAVIASYGIALAALGFLNPVWQTVVQAEIPSHVLARVTSYDWLLSLAATPVGYALAPLGASLWSAELPLVAAAVVVALACLGTAALPSVRRIGAEPAAPSETPAPVPETRPSITR
ncbi:putative MFS family arabinose efflux permease [Micromonospora pisi]|uniref:Putative MFS family arabinose efflux permease n=1 Tax=Micromonospora pisi TaxID=589240 RepID=A0A495JES7_9ACTN|nr:MFS transporter [Micromonospora pisi]RKR87028.1 putative MFS family arabinose efflux permease [Micromonospora pisi]